MKLKVSINKKITLNFLKLKIAIQMAIFYGLLVFTYFFVVHPKYNYMGFVLNYTASSVIIGGVSLITLLLLGIFIKSKFLYSIGSLVLIFFSIPYIIIYQFVYPNNQILLGQFLFIVIYILGANINLSKIKQQVNLVNIHFSIQLLIAIIILIIIPFIVIYYNNINIGTLWFDGIYNTRAVFKAKSNLFTGYSFSWMARVMLPITLIYGLINKKRIFVILALVSLLFLYLISGHKSLFIGSIIVVVFYYGSYYQKTLSFIKVINITILVGLASYYLFDNLFISSIFARRAFLLPALLNQYYFEFFANAPIYWSNSLLSFVYDYPFHLTPAYLIGEQYFGSTEMAANNGIISDGFMNAGLWGVLINVIMFTIYFKLIESFKIDSRFYGVFFFMLINIMSSSFTVVMITHGGLYLILLLTLFNLNKKYATT